tara:strand:+ start:121 stop:708 length:588 start_codon:yes stop_codon:yes gene_type:complete
MLKSFFVKVICFVVALGVMPTNAESINSLEEERTKQLQELGVLLPNPEKIIASAEQEFKKPIENQSADILKEIAEEANHYANLVAKTSDEYTDYLRENSRYDFVTEEVRRASVIRNLGNQDIIFKNIRNRAYLNLGRLALAEGQDMKAFLLFNDAFRLSAFSCSYGKDKCIRYEAEQYMKKLLGIEGESYVNWQK